MTKETMVMTMDELGKQALRKLPDSVWGVIRNEAIHGDFGISRSTGGVSVNIVRRRDNEVVAKQLEVLSLDEMMRLTQPLGLHKGGNPEDLVTWGVSDDGLYVYRHSKEDMPDQTVFLE